ncbi:MAG: response regulator [Candidatus Rokubacteria bacterium]|nr:response regulator [Candidatus Rokubacteria bacterium]
MSENAPTILCVDDDPDVLSALQEYLAAQGYHVITATNGVEAFLQVSRQRPRAVILDLFMPRLGGLGALDRIRRMDASITVIIISGVEGAVEMIREASLSVAGTLAKPFKLAEILGLLVQAGVLPPKKVPAGAGMPSPAAAPSGRRRVLVVDDDPEIRSVLVEYLQGKGFEVLQAGSGEEAIGRLTEFRPHVVLLDIIMPGLSGVETLRRIKSVQPGTAVVMVSGIEDQETARQALVLGAADYVAKPVDFQYLDSVLQIHLFMGRLDSKG